MNIFAAPLSGMTAFSTGTLINAHNVANGQTKDYRAVRADFNEGTNRNGVEVSVDEDRAMRSVSGDVVDITVPTSQNDETSQNMDNPNPNDVDYAREFSSSVIYQRGFEANAATIQTQDEMVGATLDMKV